MRGNAIHDQPEMQDHEGQEDRHQHQDRFLHAAEIEARHHDHDRQLGCQLEGLRLDRQQAEERVDAAGQRGRDGEHVVDQQRRARHQSGARPQQGRGHAVAAAAGGEQLDDLVVADRDDEYRAGGGKGKEECQRRVGAKGQECLLGPVARGGKPVGAQPHPGQHRHHGDRVAGFRRERVERLAGQVPPPLRQCRHVRHLGCDWDAIGTRLRLAASLPACQHRELGAPMEVM